MNDNKPFIFDDVVIATVCELCKGDGHYDEGDTAWGCGECDCSGYILTDRGRELVSFIYHFCTGPIHNEIKRLEEKLCALKKNSPN